MGEAQARRSALDAQAARTRECVDRERRLEGLAVEVVTALPVEGEHRAIHHLLEIPLGYTGLSEDAISVIAFIVALILVTFLHVVIGEMVPKNLSFSVPDRAALILAPPVVMVARVFRPISFSLNWLANGVLRLFKVEPKDEATSAFTLDEVADIVEQSTGVGVLADTTGTLSAAFEFTAKDVADVEVPIEAVVMLPPNLTPTQIRQAVATHGHSRYVVTDSDGGPTGYLHLKDVIDLAASPAADQPVPSKRIRRLCSVQRTADLEDALATMRHHGSHIARTHAANGRTTGILFLEDIIEELVGKVDDATTA